MNDTGEMTAVQPRRVPIRRRLITIIMATSIAALVVLSVVFLSYDRISARRSLAEETAVLANVLADRSRAALVFDDAELARTNLSALASTRVVTLACMYTNEGALFAAYSPQGPDTRMCPPGSGPDGRRFSAEAISSVQAVELEGERIGTLLLQADLGELDERLLRQSAAMLLIVILVSLAALALATRLQRVISRPVESLAQTAKSVAHGPDYSVRAQASASDELGDLVQVFNAMLTTIEEQNRALVTAKEHLEEMVEIRTEELRKVQAELVRNERLATIGQLAATVSHELRNPLGTIANASSMLIRLTSDGSESRLQDISRIIERNMSRCVNIIDDMLEFARVRPLELQPLQIDAWLNELLDEYQLPAGVTLVRQLKYGDTVPFDVHRLHLALINLLDNACEAITEAEPMKGTVTVATRRRDGWVEIVVSDSGPGIAPEHLREVFEPLYSSKTFGVGLGLALVRQVLEQHGGHVEVDTERGRGARLVMMLPAAAD